MKYDVDHDKRDDRRTSRPEVTKPVPQTKKKGGAGKTKWGDHVQPEDTHGPMVVGATPSGGVTLREGDSTQRADIKASKGRMTRAEYKKMLDSMGVSRDPGQAEPDKQKQKDGGGGGAGGRPGPAGGGVPAPTESASKPAAGTGTAAVVQQMPGNRPKFATGTPTDKPPGGYTGGGSNANGAGGGGDGKVNAPAYLKPQPIAPIPQYAHAVAKGDLVVNHRSRKKDLSPRANERLAPLPPPLYPASQGHAGVPEEVEAEAGSPGKASSAAARKKELVHIAQEADGMCVWGRGGGLEREARGNSRCLHVFLMLCRAKRKWGKEEPNVQETKSRKTSSALYNRSTPDEPSKDKSKPNDQKKMHVT